MTDAKHGGKRQGAGRKPLAEKTIRATVTILESDYTYLQSLDPELSKAIRLLVAAARKS